MAFRGLVVAVLHRARVVALRESRSVSLGVAVANAARGGQAVDCGLVAAVAFIIALTLVGLDLDFGCAPKLSMYFSGTTIN